MGIKRWLLLEQQKAPPEAPPADRELRMSVEEMKSVVAMVKDLQPAQANPDAPGQSKALIELLAKVVSAPSGQAAQQPDSVPMSQLRQFSEMGVSFGGAANSR